MLDPSQDTGIEFLVGAMSQNHQAKITKKNPDEFNHFFDYTECGFSNFGLDISVLL